MATYDAYEIVGKTVESVFVAFSFITIHFTDGEEITFRARGTEKKWIEVD